MRTSAGCLHEIQKFALGAFAVLRIYMDMIIEEKSVSKGVQLMSWNYELRQKSRSRKIPQGMPSDFVIRDAQLYGRRGYLQK